MAESLRITVNEVRRRIDNGEQILFADVRNPQAWGESDVQLPRAVRVPLDEYEQHLGELPKGRLVVAYCT